VGRNCGVVDTVTCSTRLFRVETGEYIRVEIQFNKLICVYNCLNINLYKRKIIMQYIYYAIYDYIICRAHSIFSYTVQLKFNRNAVGCFTIIIQ